MPLTRIPKETLKDFMDDYCITVDDLHDDDSDDDYGDKDPGADDNDLLDEYDPSFFTNTSDLPVQFNYRFLAPTFNHRSMIDKNKSIKDEVVPEMDVLYHITHSKRHHTLVTHPVIKSYIWLKWKLISKLFHRNLRMRCYYVFVLTWFLLSQFGGVAWRQNECSSKNGIIDGIINCNASNQTTSVETNYSICRDTEFHFDFQPGYHHECLHNSPMYFLYLAVAVIIALSSFGAFKDDFLRKWYDHEGFFKINKKMIMFIIACWLDFWTFVLLFLVVWKSSIILWFVISVILVLTLTREMHQMSAMKLEYLKQPGKWFDLLHFALVIVILYVPNRKITDPITFSSPEAIKILCDSKIGTIEEWNKGSCSIKRCLAAFTIVFAWSRLIVTMVKHPYLQKFNIYLQMFSKVTSSFLKFLFWYSFFMISFVLGFYVMLHNDLGDTNASLRGTKFKTSTFTDFNYPNEAVLKTMAMYLGELDFSAMPIGIENGMKHGNISISMIQLFVLAFMFFIVIVLGNLLNGLAVSDTGEILRTAGILHQVSLVKVLSYGEGLIMGNMRSLQNLSHKFPKTKGFIDKTFISALSSILLLNSFIDFLPDRFPQLEVTIPLTVEEEFDVVSDNKIEKNKVMKYWAKFLKLINYTMRSIPFCDEELNHGCKHFLQEAREILKEKRLAKVEQRKQIEKLKNKNDHLKKLIREELKTARKLEKEEKISE